MISVYDLKEGDTLYAYSIYKDLLEIYYVNGLVKDIINCLDASSLRLDYMVLIGEQDNVNGHGLDYIMFPEDVDLDEPVLCMYNTGTWWIYTTNFDKLQKLMNYKDIKSKFRWYLSIWKQEVILL